MPRYIDADALMKKCFSRLGDGEVLYRISPQEITEAPTANVVEVVRCKDCTHWESMDNGISWHNRGRTDGMCDMLYRMHYAERHLTSEDHYCSYGKRKEQT